MPSPILIYDGDCAFCRYWVQRWRKHTHGVKYAPYQKVGDKFPQVKHEEFARAAYYIDANGRAYRAAAAVFKLWTHRSRWGKFLWSCYRVVPPFRGVSEWAYRFIAKRRSFFWTVTKLLFRT